MIIFFSDLTALEEVSVAVANKVQAKEQKIYNNCVIYIYVLYIYKYINRVNMSQFFCNAV